MKTKRTAQLYWLNVTYVDFKDVRVSKAVTSGEFHVLGAVGTEYIDVTICNEMDACWIELSGVFAVDLFHKELQKDLLRVFYFCDLS